MGRGSEKDNVIDLTGSKKDGIWGTDERWWREWRGKVKEVLPVPVILLLSGWRGKGFHYYATPHCSQREA